MSSQLLNKLRQEDQKLYEDYVYRVRDSRERLSQNYSYNSLESPTILNRDLYDQNIYKNSSRLGYNSDFETLNSPNTNMTKIKRLYPVIFNSSPQESEDERDQRVGTYSSARHERGYYGDLHDANDLYMRNLVSEKQDEISSKKNEKENKENKNDSDVTSQISRSFDKRSISNRKYSLQKNKSGKSLQLNSIKLNKQSSKNKINVDQSLHHIHQNVEKIKKKYLDFLHDSKSKADISPALLSKKSFQKIPQSKHQPKRNFVVENKIKSAVKQSQNQSASTHKNARNFSLLQNASSKSKKKGISKAQSSTKNGMDKSNGKSISKKSLVGMRSSLLGFGKKPQELQKLKFQPRPFSSNQSTSKVNKYSKPNNFNFSLSHSLNRSFTNFAEEKRMNNQVDSYIEKLKVVNDLEKKAEEIEKQRRRDNESLKARSFEPTIVHPDLDTTPHTLDFQKSSEDLHEAFVSSCAKESHMEFSNNFRNLLDENYKKYCSLFKKGTDEYEKSDSFLKKTAKFQKGGTLYHEDTFSELRTKSENKKPIQVKNKYASQKSFKKNTEKENSIASNFRTISASKSKLSQKNTKISENLLTKKRHEKLDGFLRIIKKHTLKCPLLEVEIRKEGYEIFL